MASERLHRALARAGVASRRTSEDLIRQGRVAVNGQTVREMGIQIDPSVDRISVDGRTVDLAQAQERPIYLALNKPAGYISSASDPEGRQTVLDLLPPDLTAGARVYPVGRLDYDSEGLLLLTNDGDFTNRMTHPRYSPPKEYHVLVHGIPEPETLAWLRRGIVLDGRPTAPAQVEIIEQHLPAYPDRSAPSTWLRFVLHEGRNRQIRRMSEAVGLAVERLIRVRIGPLSLGRLMPGQARLLRPEEIRVLLAATKTEQ